MQRVEKAFDKAKEIVIGGENRKIETAYKAAREIYAEAGVDTDKAIEKLESIPVSIHCWQGDDVRGFEKPDGDLTGGIQTTGNYPGRAANIEELKKDIDFTFSLVPGKKRLNLHAIYLDNQGEKVDRAGVQPKHFEIWLDWAKEHGYGLDFNPTCFSHPYTENGMTLSAADKGIRDYWIEHCKACRRIAAYFGRELNDPSVDNIWVPDGFKDVPASRLAARERLLDSLDSILSENVGTECLDSVESKVFGIGYESCTVGSHEFYMGYAMTRNTLLTLDSGHFHPTEVISDKIPSILLYLDQILLHVSRPVRWDSDHVVIFDDELKAIAQEIIRGGFEKRVHIGLDYFDASINRIAAWTVGARNMQRALLYALTEPYENLVKAERELDYTSRLALSEEYKSYPFGAVWDYYCHKQGVPVREGWLSEVKDYEKKELAGR